MKTAIEYITKQINEPNINDNYTHAQVLRIVASVLDDAVISKKVMLDACTKTYHAILLWRRGDSNFKTDLNVAFDTLKAAMEGSYE